MKKYIIILLCIAGASAKAQTTTTAVPFLRISPDARAGGMGNVGLATTADPSSIFYNAAKTPFGATTDGVSANYSPWLRNIAPDMYLASISGYHQLDNVQAIQAGIRYFNLGSTDYKDNSGQYLGSFKPSEFSVDLGYSRKLSDNAALAVGFSYINSNLIGNSQVSGTKTGQAVAANISYYFHQEGGWSFGAAATNLGTKVSYEKTGGQSYFIPANLGIGANYEFLADDLNHFNFSLDLNKSLVPANSNNVDSTSITGYNNKSVVGSWFSSFGDGLKSITVAVGAEYWYNNIFALRTGYYYEDQSQGNRKYLSTGASVRYQSMIFNFSYIVPSGGIDGNPLANTLNFGLTFELSGK